MSYRTFFVVRHVMPDDRLASVHLDEDGVFVFGHRYGHVHPDLVRAMRGLSNQVSESGAVDLAEAGGGGMAAHFEIVREDLLLPTQAMAWRVGAGPAFEMQCREGLIDPAMIRELNTEVMPWVCSRLRVLA
jgi:hypothetical protein